MYHTQKNNVRDVGQNELGALALELDLDSCWGGGGVGQKGAWKVSIGH